jgi:hypothetical protein
VSYSASAWASLLSLGCYLALAFFFGIVLSRMLLLATSHLLLDRINSSNLSMLKNETDDKVSKVCVTMSYPA